LIAAIDTSVLIFLFDGNAPAPIDVETDLIVTDVKARIDYLILNLSKNKAKLIIPTPALAEILVTAGGAGPEWLAILNKSSVFKIASFDVLAAVEHAALQQERKGKENFEQKLSKKKAKFDDQIIAIAAVEQAEVIYTDDKDIRKNASGRFKVLGIADLPLPPEAAQFDMKV
jgi:predicted nucleic acid-binding protein